MSALAFADDVALISENKYNLMILTETSVNETKKQDYKKLRKNSRKNQGTQNSERVPKKVNTLMLNENECSIFKYPKVTVD